MVKKVVFLAMAMLVACSACFAQKAKTSRKKIVNLRGEYTYHVPENITLEDAKQIARERAIQQCLADEFGTLVSQNNSTITITNNGKTDMKNYTIGGVEVKGEWLGDTKAAVYTPKIDEQTGTLIVSVKVWGKAREIEIKAQEISAKVLCNGTDDRYEREIVYEGDRFYVAFSSLTSGYLCMYLVDEDQNAFCLLPYAAESNGSHRVEGNLRYVFFSPEHAEDENIVDEYIMSCARDSEINMLYVIFSPNEFSRPLEDITSQETITLPVLEEWLLKTRSHDTEMQLLKQSITIKKAK